MRISGPKDRVREVKGMHQRKIGAGLPRRKRGERPSRPPQHTRPQQ